MAQVLVCKGERRWVFHLLEGDVVSLAPVLARVRSRMRPRDGRGGPAMPTGATRRPTASHGGPVTASTRHEDSGSASEALLVRVSDRLRDEAECWTLVVSPRVSARVNGGRVQGGLRVLEHGDEIHLRAAGFADVVHFSTEQVVRVEPYPESGEAIPCARCRSAMRPGAPAVRCPRCGRWYHQEAPGAAPAEAEGESGSAAVGSADTDAPRGRCCWTYDETCRTPGCNRVTRLDGKLHWTPEEG